MKAAESTKSTPQRSMEKTSTQIEGLDVILEDGLPCERVTLVVGTAGSGKTIVGCEWLWRSISKTGQAAVFVTFEESPQRIMHNVKSFGWDFEKALANRQLAFVELHKSAIANEVTAGHYNLSVVVARIAEAVASVGANLVFIDSISAFFEQLGSKAPARRMLLDLSNQLGELGVTTLMSAERFEEYGSLSSYRSETFVSDCVIILRHLLLDERTRRTVQVLKYRGSSHKQGEFPFSISPDGIVVMPSVGMTLDAKSSTLRIATGNADLDRMTGGGLFRDSISLVSGPTGTGKTLLASQFVHAACLAGERALLFAFEESREQLLRNGASWGMDLSGMEEKGLLKIVCAYPESSGPEDHLLRLKREIAAFAPQRMALDSLSALERVINVRSFREFVITLTSYVKMRQMAGLLTNTTTSLLGGESITETHISTLTDAIILLRYVETGGRMRRGITVLKLRGSDHEKEIFEYRLSNKGLQVGEPFSGIESIMTGSPRQVAQAERDALRKVLGRAP